MKTNTLVLKSRLVAILMIAAGYGWAGGHFIPENSPLYYYFFQFIVLLILVALSVNFFNRLILEGVYPKRSTVGLNIFAAITLVVNIANVIRGISNSGHDAFGSHNTLADLIPIGLIVTGDIIWLMIPLFNKPSAAKP